MTKSSNKMRTGEKKYDKNINDFRNLEDLHKTQFIYITNIHDESP